MAKLQFETSPKGAPDFQADALLGTSVFEVLIDPRDLRRLRSALMALARLCASEDSLRGILILDEPRISAPTLDEELKALPSFLLPDIIQRLCIVIRRENHPDQVEGYLSPEEQRHIDTVADHVRNHSNRPVQRSSEASFDILRILLIHFFRKSGPLLIKQICEESGFTYPTVSKVLGGLKPNLKRHSDRSVELHSFPQEAWIKMVVTAPKNRGSLAFHTPSGKPRSIDALINRVLLEGNPAIAGGGIIGARHYLPGIDLVGIPRLDLTWQHPSQSDVSDFVRRLDPALKPIEPGATPQLVIHRLHRPHSFYRHTTANNLIADEVESLLDLHEARLEPQAAELLNHLIRQAKT